MIAGFDKPLISSYNIKNVSIFCQMEFFREYDRDFKTDNHGTYILKRRGTNVHGQAKELTN